MIDFPDVDCWVWTTINMDLVTVSRNNDLGVAQRKG